MRCLKPGIVPVGAVDWDRRLFDELIPLPDGTSYNAYVVRGGEKVTLVDSVDPVKVEVLIDNLVKAGVSKLDYIVAHHAEQDHSGAITDILMLFPGSKVVTSEKCKGMLIEPLDIEDDRFITIEDGQTLSLGDKTLQFIFTPWVHWPETLCSYLQEDKILFSCDFFGSHLATTNMFVRDEAVVLRSAKRYYAEIMMPFRLPIKKNLEKIKDLDIDMIAPSHGPIYDKPSLIVDAYKQWTSDEVANEVVLAYVSMHDSTKKMAEYLVEALVERGIKVRLFNLTETDTGKLAMALVDAATLVIGSPTVLTGPHPKAAYAVMLANLLRPKTKFVSIIGSFGWAGKMIDQLKSFMPNIKAEILEPVLARGCPGDDDFEALETLADAILAKHEELEIMD